MKKIVPTILFLIVCGIPLSQESPLLGATARRTPLQFTTSIVKEKSCAPDHMSLELRFSFKNIGSEPVIIDKQSFVMRTMVSESMKAAAAKRYQTESRAHLYADVFPLSPTDMADFAVVQPSETYDLQTRDTRVSIDIDDGAPRSRENLRPGSYFLQVEIATWTYLNDPKQFRERWKKSGLLWSEGLTSQPMPFVIAQDRPISKCGVK